MNFATTRSELKLPFSVTVTSISFCRHNVIVGCDDGTVICYDTRFTSHDYQIIGQIQSKVYNNTQTIVKVSEDNSFVFVGTRKGSNESLALDMRKLHEVQEATSTPLLYTDFIIPYKHKDNKLRGFGGVAKVNISSNVNTSMLYDSDKDVIEYRLVCGMGIKNLHVWKFILTQNTDPTHEVISSEWSYLCDIVTNGITVECADILSGGTEIMSKSTGVNIRLWKLTPESGMEPKSKISYEEVPNTNDARALFERYAYGGTYDLAVVKFGMNKNVNRDDIHIPGPQKVSFIDNDPSKRKRKLREIEQIIGTPDGECILVLCTDGGVMYFNTETASTHDTSFDSSLSKSDGSQHTESLHSNDSHDVSSTENHTADKNSTTTTIESQDTIVTIISDADSTHSATTSFMKPTSRSRLITELEHLSYDPDRDTCWAMTRNSSAESDSTSRDNVLLYRARKEDDGNYITVTCIHDLLHPHQTPQKPSAPVPIKSIKTKTPMTLMRNHTLESNKENIPYSSNTDYTIGGCVTNITHVASPNDVTMTATMSPALTDMDKNMSVNATQSSSDHESPVTVNEVHISDNIIVPTVITEKKTSQKTKSTGMKKALSKSLDEVFQSVDDTNKGYIPTPQPVPAYKRMRRDSAILAGSDMPFTSLRASAVSSTLHSGVLSSSSNSAAGDSSNTTPLVYNEPTFYETYNSNIPRPVLSLKPTPRVKRIQVTDDTMMSADSTVTVTTYQAYRVLILETVTEWMKIFMNAIPTPYSSVLQDIEDVMEGLYKHSYSYYHHSIIHTQIKDAIDMHDAVCKLLYSRYIQYIYQQISQYLYRTHKDASTDISMKDQFFTYLCSVLPMSLVDDLSPSADLNKLIFTSLREEKRSIYDKLRHIKREYMALGPSENSFIKAVIPPYDTSFIVTSSHTLIHMIKKCSDS